MACILKDQLHSVLSSSQTFITRKNLRSLLNEAGWPNRSWLASVKEFVCCINKFSTYFAVSDYTKFLICFLGWLVSWKWAGSVSILTFNHGIAHPRKQDRLFFFAQAPCNENKVFNKQGVLTCEMGWPTKWPGYTYRGNKKTLTHWPNQPWLPGQSVPYNQPLSYIRIFKRTFSEILLMRRYFLLCFGTAAYN